MIYITGDTHGEEARMRDHILEKTLTKDDHLIITGDFGYISDDSYWERLYLRELLEKPYRILFIDGNHENFDIIESYPDEEWCGGKVHVIRREEGNPKIIHLMRGQVFEIEGKTVFSFGGAYSRDKYMRRPNVSWWPREMPNEEEYKEGIDNLKKHNNRVDYIVTHTVPEEIMCTFHPEHSHEKPLNTYLEWVKQNIEFKHWYAGHLHQDRDIDEKMTLLFFKLRNIETNEIIED